MAVAHVEDAGDAGDGAADRCVHEAGKERNAAEGEEAGFRVCPRARVGFEHFHQRADTMEDQDHFGFGQRFHPQQQEHGLHDKSSKKQEVVTGERGSQSPRGGVASLAFLLRFVPDQQGGRVGTAAVSIMALARPGDLNGDGTVNLTDAEIMAQALNTPPQGNTAIRDLNGDGRIEMADSTLLQAACRPQPQCARARPLDAGQDGAGLPEEGYTPRQMLIDPNVKFEP